MREWVRYRDMDVDDAVEAEPSGVVSWGEVVRRADLNNVDSLFLSDLSFHNVFTYEVDPGEDLCSAIRRHAKVRLNPRHVYTLGETGHLDCACYVIGNGATIVVNCAIGFTITSHEFAPRVNQMEDVVFLGCNFQAGSYRGGKVKAIKTDRFVIVQSCLFTGFMGCCISTKSGCRIKACQFLCCNIGVVSYHLTSSIKQCIFQRVAICAVGQGRLFVKRCTAIDCHTFVIFGSVGSVSECSVMGAIHPSSMRRLRLCTCMCGHVRRLHTVHVVSNRTLPWPSMNMNTFSNCTVYLGHRRGVFHPSCTSMHFSVVNVESASSHRVTFSHCYDGFCRVRQISPVLSDGTPNYPVEGMLCHCRHIHLVCRMRVIDMTREAFADRSQVSVANGDYSSEEDW